MREPFYTLTTHDTKRRQLSQLLCHWPAVVLLWYLHGNRNEP